MTFDDLCELWREREDGWAPTGLSFAADPENRLLFMAVDSAKFEHGIPEADATLLRDALLELFPLEKKS